MSYQDVMNTILPQQQGRHAHVTDPHGERRADNPHGGSDFNYDGGQAGKNLDHPSIHSPIAGTVEYVGGRYGTINIRDAEGNNHQLLHTQSQSVVVGQRVEAGTQIGTMGGRGPRGEEQYPQHVHYQIQDARGNNIDPQAFWDRRQSVGAQTTGGLLSDPDHPNHAMYRQALEGVERLGPQAGFHTAQDRERAAATLTYDARMNGMDRIDHVVQNVNGTGVFAVQGALNDPAHHRVFADKQQAMAQTVEQSSQQLAQDGPALTQQAVAQTQEPQQPQPPNSPRMTMS